MFDASTAINKKERYTKPSVAAEAARWEIQGRRDCRNGVKNGLSKNWGEPVPKKFWDDYLTGYMQAQAHRMKGR